MYSALLLEAALPWDVYDIEGRSAKSEGVPKRYLELPRPLDHSERERERDSASLDLNHASTSSLPPAQSSQTG